MQPVHVLGDQGIHPAALLQPCQPFMRRVGMDVAELVPPCTQALLCLLRCLLPYEPNRRGQLAAYALLVRATWYTRPVRWLRGWPTCKAAGPVSLLGFC